MRGKRRKFTTKFISALLFGIYHQNELTFFIKPLWMEVMVFSRYRRAVGRDRGELDPAIVLEVFILEQPRPGRLGTSSPPAALSPGLQITELDLQQEKRTLSRLYYNYTISVIFVWLKMITINFKLWLKNIIIRSNIQYKHSLILYLFI